MAKDQYVLLAATYADEDRAKTVLDMLQQMHKASTVTLSDSAMVTKGSDGKLNVTETKDLSAKQGLKKGAIIGGIAGVVFPPSLLVGAVAGGALGGVWGKLRDTGIKSKSMQELGDKLEPGKAAVLVLASQDSVSKLETALQGYDGELVRHDFTPEESATIESAPTT